MVKQITGQSIRYEPVSLGIGLDSFHPTSFERYARAQQAVASSKLNVMSREDKGAIAPATTETLQRTLALNPRETQYSNGISTAPLISGLASDTSGGYMRAREIAEGRDMMLVNTIRNAQYLPQI